MQRRRRAIVADIGVELPGRARASMPAESEHLVDVAALAQHPEEVGCGLRLAALADMANSTRSAKAALDGRGRPVSARLCGVVDRPAQLRRPRGPCGREQRGGRAIAGARGAAMLALGLMSGTSMDGIDLALIETDGGDRARASGRPAFGPTPTRTARCCAHALADAVGLDDRDGPARRAGRGRGLRHGTAMPRPSTRSSPTMGSDRARPRRHRLPRPDRAAPARTAARPSRSATGRGWRARSASTSWPTCAPPTSRRAGRARRWCRSSTGRWPQAVGARPAGGRCSTSAASPTSRCCRRAAATRSPSTPAPATRCRRPDAGAHRRGLRPRRRRGGRGAVDDGDRRRT